MIGSTRAERTLLAIDAFIADPSLETLKRLIENSREQNVCIRSLIQAKGSITGITCKTCEIDKQFFMPDLHFGPLSLCDILCCEDDRTNVYWLTHSGEILLLIIQFKEWLLVQGVEHE